MSIDSLKSCFWTKLVTNNGDQVIIPGVSSSDYLDLIDSTYDSNSEAGYVSIGGQLQSSSGWSNFGFPLCINIDSVSVITNIEHPNVLGLLSDGKYINQWIQCYELNMRVLEEL